MLSCAPRNAGANQQSSLSFSQKAKLKRKGLLKSSLKKKNFSRQNLTSIRHNSPYFDTWFK